ncbi:MAG: DUF4435 domain-containing protein [Lachnospiraceae bacterium]|nr:DUF4435 domain-containing protein [Lachnospiraceae bacterium]
MNVQEMREARTKAVVVFTKFIQSKDRFDQDLFCFFEGEDIKYYEPRIEEYTEISYANIVSFDCGGKSGVLKIRSMIKEKGIYENVRKAFFIDRDFFPTDIEDEELYETPCYSVENFYTSKSAFARVLKTGFGINLNEDDFERCMNDFLRTQNCFHQSVTELNAWLKCQRRGEMECKKRNVELSNFKISEFFEKIAIDEVKLRKIIDTKILYEKFPKALEINDKELANEVYHMRGCNQSNDFRGKFELWFFKKVIDDLRSKNKNNMYFKEHRECVKIDPNVDTLLQLSLCADTPRCLKEFLSQYKRAS